MFINTYSTARIGNVADNPRYYQKQHEWRQATTHSLQGAQ